MLLVLILFLFFVKSILIDKYDLFNLYEIVFGGVFFLKEVGEVVVKCFYFLGI